MAGQPAGKIHSMPELPEVETMVRDLEGQMVGRRITGVDLPFAAEVKYPDPLEFRDRVVGRTVNAISRRGKYAAFQLDGADVLIIHRGMTGSLFLRNSSDPQEAHIRVLFRLDDGRELRFNDPRKFGSVLLMERSGLERPLPWLRMGPEPLDDEFDAATLRRALARRTALLKPLLLNQSVVAGLGNIYADEALHLARIHPQRRADTLSTHETKRLHAAIRTVLAEAIAGRGTTFSSYRDYEGREGDFQHRLRVFGRTGAACPRCGTAIIKLVVGGRGTHMCPRCQKV
jgi:formamidopyrimidine-DNA glycosylase